jgi:hypothetical protein
MTLKDFPPGTVLRLGQNSWKSGIGFILIIDKDVYLTHTMVFRVGPAWTEWFEENLNRLNPVVL